MSIEQVKTVLALHPEICLAYVFGSVATGEARPDSDVDVAVKAASRLDTDLKMQLIEELAESTGRPVDLIDLYAVGEPLLGQILKYGVRVVGEDSAHAELISRHIFSSEDFMPYVARMLAERRKKWIG